MSIQEKLCRCGKVLTLNRFFMVVTHEKPECDDYLKWRGVVLELYKPKPDTKSAKKGRGTKMASRAGKPTFAKAHPTKDVVGNMASKDPVLRSPDREAAARMVIMKMRPFINSAGMTISYAEAMDLLIVMMAEVYWETPEDGNNFFTPY